MISLTLILSLSRRIKTTSKLKKESLKCLWTTQKSLTRKSSMQESKVLTRNLRKLTEAKCRVNSKWALAWSRLSQYRWLKQAVTMNLDQIMTSWKIYLLYRRCSLTRLRYSNQQKNHLLRSNSSFVKLNSELITISGNWSNLRPQSTLTWISSRGLINRNLS